MPAMQLTRSEEEQQPPDPPEPEPTGPLDQQAIQRGVERHVAAIRFCYTRGSGREGTTTVRFQINPDGHVDAVAKGLEPVVDACIATQIEKIWFPSPKPKVDMLNVVYPFTYKR